MKKELYAIIGLAKLKTAGNIQGVIAHMMRERETPNANGKQNDIRIRPPELADIMARIDSYLPRKNAVIAYDFLMAASPEWFAGKSDAEVEAWKRDSVEWLQRTFGRDNVIGLVFHHDESSAGIHAQAVIIPEWNHKLCAAHFTDGRAKMRGLWTSYAAAMAKHGLKRGKLYSPAEHKAIKEYYAQVNAAQGKAEAMKVRPEQLPAPALADRVDPQSYAADLINYSLAWYRKETAALREELAAEREARERMAKKVSSSLVLARKLQEDPEAYKRLRDKLAAERQGRAADKKKFVELVNAVREYFRKNIDRNSVLRKPEALGRLQNIPEVADAVRIDLTPDVKARAGDELTL